MSETASAAEPQSDRVLQLADRLFQVSRGEVPVESLVAAVERDGALPFWEASVAAGRVSAAVQSEVWKTLPRDAIEERNREERRVLTEKIADARLHHGESEMREALVARSEYLARIGDVEQAVRSYEAALRATVGAGQRIDIYLAQIRLGLAVQDYRLVRRAMSLAREHIERGGDWERRNRFRVYEAVFVMTARRDLSGAADRLLDSLATFTATELMPLSRFIFYTVVCSLATKERPLLRDRVAKAPEVLQVILQYPPLAICLRAFVNCAYLDISRSLPGVLMLVRRDRLLHMHERYIAREIRVAAYAQYLVAYKSVTLASMAAAFGVGAEFLDEELSRFIASERLHAKIDRVAGVIQTTRSDTRSARYHQIIRDGDALLNRIQKLSRVIDV